MSVTIESTKVPVALTPWRTNIVFVTVALGMLMAALDQTIVSTALPTIVDDLGGSGHIAWVTTAYLLAEAISTVLAGKFGDLFGRKRIFQLSAVVFIAGSMLAGLSNDMVTLIGARALQGVGGGGLMVTAMALIADVIPLQRRGKYQGALGAIFGITTVLGPTLGGLFTDHLSWRWCFYVNVPVALVMLVLAARNIPVVRSAVRPIIDYLGIAAIALGVTGLILALEWGGQQYAWGSAVIIGLFAGAAVLLAAFVAIEMRAREPMLPMQLFRNPVFAVCSVLSFIVGFAMLGSITYLPTYVQYVDGVSATESGIRTLPLVVGLIITSILSGNVVGTTGRYRYFPIFGMAAMAVGLSLMSTMGRSTGVWRESLYMLILGLGIGASMQVLTIVVQNTVPYAQLGTATSGVTFFRTLGGTFGTAIFGVIYSNKLTPALADALSQVPGVPASVAQSPSALRALPEAQTAPIIDAYATAIDSVFRWVVPIALVGFVVAWFLKEVPLRDSSRAAATDMGEGFAVPDAGDNTELLERAIAGVLGKNKNAGPPQELLEHSVSGLGPEMVWALVEVDLRRRARTVATVAGIAHQHRLPEQLLQPLYTQAMDTGYLVAERNGLRLTESGDAEIRGFEAAWRRWLDAQLDDWTFTDPRDQALLDKAMDNIAQRLVDEQEFAPRPTAGAI